MFFLKFEFKNVRMLCHGRHKYVDLQQKVLKVEVWTIVETITSTFNLVVLACVMNQSNGHWLFSNALTIVITIIMNMEVELLQLSNKFEIFDPVEAKIFLLHINM